MEFSPCILFYHNKCNPSILLVQVQLRISVIAAILEGEIGLDRHSKGQRLTPLTHDQLKLERDFWKHHFT